MGLTEANADPGHLNRPKTALLAETSGMSHGIAFGQLGHVDRDRLSNPELVPPQGEEPKQFSRSSQRGSSKDRQERGSV